MIIATGMSIAMEEMDLKAYLGIRPISIEDFDNASKEQPLIRLSEIL